MKVSVWVAYLSFLVVQNKFKEDRKDGDDERCGPPTKTDANICYGSVKLFSKIVALALFKQLHSQAININKETIWQILK